nr:MAG: ORF1 [TTV-like mini virus]
MPWRWRRRRYPRRRRWWFWTRRPRKTFRRRYYNRVRKPIKLKRLRLLQWQPRTIRKCRISGMLCLFQCNVNRIGNNFTLYQNSIVPEKTPGGGGFGIHQIGLQTLYLEHQLVNNWWTQPNTNLPLVRYLYCTLKLYQSEDVDWVFTFQRNYPMSSTQLTYPSSQPSVMMLLKNSIKIPSKKTQKWKRPYKKIKIRPPELLTNKWFFQKSIATTPLILFTSVAASFDHYYISTDAQSDNATIPCINTNLFQNRHWGQNDIYHIKQLGDKKIYLWATWANLPTETSLPQGKQMILLANGKNYTTGTEYENLRQGQTHYGKWADYKKNIHLYSGNPFHTHYLTQQEHESCTFYQSTIEPENALPASETTQIQTENFTKIHSPLIIYTRYNPNNDTGTNNISYLLKNYQPEHGWDPYENIKLQLSGFPLYINWWGFLDFQRKQHELTNIDTATIFVTKTNQLHPELPAYVPVSYDFIQGKSPYEDNLNPQDTNRWYPQVQFQEPAVNTLLQTGPATPKFGEKNMVEAKLKYDFYFKFGGDPAPMVDVKNPTQQPQFPIPNNGLQTTSLQDPRTPPELFLYNFDQRRDFLTNKATKRISKDWQITDSIFSTTGTSHFAPEIQQTFQTSSEETSDSEKEAETLLEQLQLQQRRQKRIKHRIKRLLTQIQST